MVLCMFDHCYLTYFIFLFGYTAYEGISLGISKPTLQTNVTL